MPRPRKSTSPFRYFNSSPEVIRLVVMMYVRFPLSLRNVEDLLFERGIDISHDREDERTSAPGLRSGFAECPDVGQASRERGLLGSVGSLKIGSTQGTHSTASERRLFNEPMYSLDHRAVLPSRDDTSRPVHVEGGKPPRLVSCRSINRCLR